MTHYLQILMVARPVNYGEVRPRISTCFSWNYHRCSASMSNCLSERIPIP